MSLCGIQSARATAFQLFTQMNAYKSGLVGDWEVVSKVIWSDSPYVKEGQKSISDLSIEEINGTLYPHWEAGEWKMVRSKVLDFNIDKSLHWERESKLIEDRDHYWYVRSVNKFDFSDSGQFKGKSYHKEYLNGELVGTYITQSYLHKKS